MKKIDWNTTEIDWSRRDADIARELGVTRSLVGQRRPRAIPTVPEGLEFTGYSWERSELARKHGVTTSVVDKWMAQIKPTKPKDFCMQGSLRATAEHYGVGQFIIRKWRAEHVCDHAIGVGFLPQSMVNRVVYSSTDREGLHYRPFNFCPHCGTKL